MYPAVEDLQAVTGLKRGNITYFPVVPGRIEFAVEVRQWLLQQRPEVIAIELPSPLRSQYMRATARLPELSIIRFPDPIDPSQWVYVPVEPTDPFVEALRTAQELGIRVKFIEPNWGDRPHLGDSYPDTYAIRMIGCEPYVESYRLEKNEPGEEMLEYAVAIARKLQGLPADREVAAIVSLNVLDPILDAMEIPQDQPIEPRGTAHQAELFNADPQCLTDITVEHPFLMERYERFRRQPSADRRLVDRLASQLAVLESADAALWRSSGERGLEAWQYRQLAKFARNLAYSSGELVADVVDLTLAARGVAGDNYASAVWDALSLYPAQRAECELATIRIASEEIWCRKRRIRLYKRPVTRPVKNRSLTHLTMAVIFDEDHGDEKYPLRVMRDHAAFYANDESECGGLVLCSGGEPMDDIWSNPRYDAAESKAERLVLAALYHTAERRILHIAAKPPRRLLRDVARHLGRLIEHVPIGQISRAELKAIRGVPGYSDPHSSYTR